MAPMVATARGGPTGDDSGEGSYGGARVGVASLLERERERGRRTIRITRSIGGEVKARAYST